MSAGDTLTESELEQLRAAAAPLGEDAVPGVLASIGLPGRLDAVPRSKVALAIAVLQSTPVSDLRPAVAAHLGPLEAESDLRRLESAMSAARNQGYRAFEAAQREYEQALAASAGVEG